MTEFAKMDVFFYVTTIAVVILTIALVIASVYLIKILKDIKYIVRKARVETELLASDIGELRDSVKEEGAKIKHWVKFFGNIYKRNKK